MMTGFGGVQDAVEAIKRGAYDFPGQALRVAWRRRS
jgi:ActR/RegA family two-component response regulator